MTLLLGSTWTVSSSAFLSPTLHIPWVLYGVRQRCNEGGYRLEQHSHLETNWQAFVKLIKYPITPIPRVCSTNSRQGRLRLYIAVEHGIPCYGNIVEAEDRKSLITSKCPVMGFHPFQLAEYDATCFRERSAHETVLRRQLWNRYSQTSSR
jgi:hypothetical protein